MLNKAVFLLVCGDKRNMHTNVVVSQFYVLYYKVNSHNAFMNAIR